MVDIAKTIFSHLQSSRSIVIPSLGAFIRKEDGKVIFSELVKKQDGVLRELLKQQEGIDDLTADAVIDRFCYDIRDRLRENDTCVFSGYGILKRLEDGSLKFEDNHEEKIVEVPQVNVPIEEPTKNTEKKNVQLQQKEDSKEHIVSRPRKTRKKFDMTMVVAAIVIILALLALLYGMYVSSLNPKDDAVNDNIERIEVDPSIVKGH
ncbi:MAG: hypothetical protein KBS95_02790 [Alistipes sp.]|nr:hypothetical protein [Candidatus Alistipes equi]